MKKRFLGFVLAICLIFPCSFMLSACDDGILDIAYVRIVPEGTQKVQYSNDGLNTYIYLLPNVSSPISDYILSISFAVDYGVETIGELDTLCIRIEDWSTMTVAIKNTYWASGMQIHLNGTDITEHKVLVSEPSGSSLNYVYTFDDMNFIKGNNTNTINTISYVLPPI